MEDLMLYLTPTLQSWFWPPRLGEEEFLLHILHTLAPFVAVERSMLLTAVYRLIHPACAPG